MRGHDDEGGPTCSPSIASGHFKANVASNLAWRDEWVTAKNPSLTSAPHEVYPRLLPVTVTAHYAAHIPGGSGMDWRHMKSAPRDGSRILVTVRPSEQGPAEVDVAYWARADQFGIEGWRAADSYPGHMIAYADPELKCWMPLPKANSGQDSTSVAEMPAPWEGDDVEELHGSGI